VVTVQLAPSANARGIEDLRVITSQFAVGDRVVIEGNGGEGGDSAAARTDATHNAGTGRTEGVILALSALSGWNEYPDLEHRVKAYGVEFSQHIDRRAHGAAVRLDTGELLGMLIATQNQPSGACRALVYAA